MVGKLKETNDELDGLGNFTCIEANAKAIRIARPHAENSTVKTLLVQELAAFLARNRPRDSLPIADLGPDGVAL